MGPPLHHHNPQLGLDSALTVLLQHPSRVFNQFIISPEDDVTNEGFDEGEYVAYYNFLTKRIRSQIL